MFAPDTENRTQQQQATDKEFIQAIKQRFTEIRREANPLAKRAPDE